jgi:dipeptidyl aminopeptidase/acylaminoacyl peptidase
LSAAQTPAVANTRLELHWSADAERAWYRCDRSGGGHEFMLVVPAEGSRRVAFDHAKMAEALQGLLGRTVESTRLPVDDLRWSDAGTTLAVRSGERWFAGPAATLALQAQTAPPSDGLPRVSRPSRSGGEDVVLTIVNNSGRRLSIAWSDLSGKRQPFGNIPSQQEKTYQTYAGHVWVLAQDGGPIIGVAEAQAGGTRIEVDEALVARLVTPKPGTAPSQRSPDGRFEAFIRDHNLWLKPLGGGEAIALTTDGSAADSYDDTFAWSPDSSHLATRRIKAGQHRMITLIESSPKDQVQPKVRTIRYDKPGDDLDQPQVCLFAIAERKAITVAQDLLTNPWSIDEFAWRADSSGFTVLYNQRGHQIMRVVEIDRRGQARSVIEERAATFIDYTNKVYYERVDARGDLLWMSERDGWNHLYRFDAVSGSLKNRITAGSWVVRSVERVDADAGLIWFTAGGVNAGEDPYHVHHGRVAFDGTGLTWLTAGDGTHDVAWSPGRRWLVDTWSRVDAAPQHVLRDGTTGRQVVALEQADLSALQASGWKAPECFVAKGRDGKTDIHGVIWRPKDFDPTKRYPVVENIYAGPHSSYAPKAFKSRYRQQDIADLGFVVAMMDGMGTSHRSKAFHDVCWKNLADAGFPDRIAWWKSAAATRPWMDLSRVGIYGGSAGGQNALGALLFHPEFYHVAVADCGCHDNRMDKVWWNEQWMGWPVGPHYAEQSNVTHAGKLQGKLMLIVGEIDSNVDPSSTFQVANALEKAGKDFELVVVHGANHGAADTPFGSKKRAAFLVRELLGTTPR